MKQAATRPYFEPDAESSALLSRAAERRERVLYGRLQLVARNAGKAPLRLRARLWRAASPGAVDAPEEGAVVELLPDGAQATEVQAASTGPAAAERTVEPADEQELRLVFVVPARGTRRRRSTGSWCSRRGRGADSAPVQRIDIPVKGAAAPMGDIGA